MKTVNCGGAKWKVAIFEECEWVADKGERYQASLQVRHIATRFLFYNNNPQFISSIYVTTTKLISYSLDISWASSTAQIY